MKLLAGRISVAKVMACRSRIVLTLANHPDHHGERNARPDKIIWRDNCGLLAGIGRERKRKDLLARKDHLRWKQHSSNTDQPDYHRRPDSVDVVFVESRHTSDSGSLQDAKQQQNPLYMPAENRNHNGTHDRATHDAESKR